MQEPVDVVPRDTRERDQRHAREARGPHEIL